MTCQKSTKHIEQCKKFAQWQQLFDLTWRMITLVASSQKYLTKTKTSANANEKTFSIKSKYFIRATKNQVVCKPLNLLKMIKWLEIWYWRPKEPTKSGSFFFSFELSNQILLTSRYTQQDLENKDSLLILSAVRNTTRLENDFPLNKMAQSVEIRGKSTRTWFKMCI